ncbi:MAG: hypothetical protein EOO03_11260, partial [Chitinophagaceae bacterium]
MQKHFLYIIICGLLVGALGGCKETSTKLPDLRERYGPMDTKPFGAYTAFRIISNSYPSHNVTMVKKPFSKFYGSTYLKDPALYINISNKYFASNDDAQSLLDFVYDGSTAFISA